jgi:hypothetical protein
VKTFSLTAVAEMALPEHWKRPVLWLERKLRAGEIGGYKVGHTWRMTEADVEAMVDRYHNHAQQPHVADSGPRALSFTRTSSRNLARSA